MIDGLKPYPAMKDSGVPWLGEVPEHWEVQPIGRIGQLFKGNGGNKGDEVSAGVACVRYGDLYTRHEYFITNSKACVSEERAGDYTPIRYGDVLFAASGETMEDIGRSAVNLIDGEARCGGDVLVLRPEIPAVPRYLGYVADSPASRNQKACMGRGFTVVHIYGSQLKRLLLPLPPLPEQSAIARFLTHATRRIHRYIRAKQKLIALLEEQKQAIIHRAVTRGLDPNVRMKPSGVEWLGDVPEHWEVVRLRYLIEGRLTYGANAAAEHDNPAWPRYLRITDFRLDGTLRSDTFRSLPPDVAKDYLVQSGDVLLARSGATVGKAFLVTAEAEAACHAGYLIRARPKRTLIEPEFLFAFTQSSGFSRWKDSTFIIATIQNIGADKYSDLLVPLPPVAEQGGIIQFLKDATATIGSATERSRHEIALLREYRTRLIADVVTGKLDVREAAARLPEEVEDAEPFDKIDSEAEGDGEEGSDAEGADRDGDGDDLG